MHCVRAIWSPAPSAARNQPYLFLFVIVQDEETRLRDAMFGEEEEKPYDPTAGLEWKTDWNEKAQSENPST